MPHRAVWRGFLHSIGLAPLLELREVEEARRLALDAAIQDRAAVSACLAQRQDDARAVERLGRDVMQRQDRAEPCRDGDPHDF